jgi:single-stranded-DNA-specific exonuclease
MAAGLTIKREAIEPFREAFNRVARDKLSKDDLVRVQRVDVETRVGRLDADLERLLRHLEPCGLGNPAPVFAVTNARAERTREVGENHLKFTIQDDTGRLEAIGFGLADRVQSGWLGGPLDVALRLEENEFRGNVTLQARVLALRPAS